MEPEVLSSGGRGLAVPVDNNRRPVSPTTPLGAVGSSENGGQWAGRGEDHWSVSRSAMGCP